MAGNRIPLVLMPRFSSYNGANNFYTIGMDVTDYESAEINAWRGSMLGTGPTFALSFEESTDQVNWSTCTNGSGGDPGSNTEAQYVPTLSKRWFRVKLALGGTAPGVTCWAIGFLVQRES